MSHLADAVLPLIRTRADLSRWSAATEHGRRMHEAVAILEEAAQAGDPVEVFTVTQKAIASALKVIARADDSSGVVGDAVRRLLDLHPAVAARANAPASKLVEWIIAFQFHSEVDFFTLDPVAYAPALGDAGLASYREKLDEIAAAAGPVPTDDGTWAAPRSHTWFTLEWNARRLAVLDRDVAAIIRTHSRDRRVAAWLQDTAEALAEIGEADLAIDWAKQATDFDRGHQSLKAAKYWCTLLAEHRPQELLPAELEVFRRWPSASSAASLYQTAGPVWPTYHDEVLERLAPNSREAVLFAVLSLKDVELGWQLAHSLGLEDRDTWTRLVSEYENVDPLAVLPVMASLVMTELRTADARQYKAAARWLSRMRRLAAGTAEAAEVDNLIAELRETHRRRPRLQHEFDRAKLP